MPYIKNHQRRALLEPENNMTHFPYDPGELNYVITRLIIYYIKNKGLSYADTVALLTGLLINIKDEFKTRVFDKYEAKKRKENGDVFDDLLEQFNLLEE